MPVVEESSVSLLLPPPLLMKVPALEAPPSVVKDSVTRELVLSELVTLEPGMSGR